MKKKIDVKNIIVLQLAFLIYSFCSMFSKLASLNSASIIMFCIFYGLSLMMLALYAIIWQQVLKKTELSVAYSCKGVTIVWGIIWGKIFFKETITFGMIIGAILVVIGIIVMMYEKEEKK